MIYECVHVYSCKIPLRTDSIIAAVSPGLLLLLFFLFDYIVSSGDLLRVSKLLSYPTTTVVLLFWLSRYTCSSCRLTTILAVILPLL